MNLPIFKLLTTYAMKRQVGVHVGWSHITRAYDVDLREIIYFKSSGQPYMMSKGNRGGDNPLEALVNALRDYMPMTILLQAYLLEAEVELLGYAIRRAKEIDRKMEAAVDALSDAFAQWPVVLMHGEEVISVTPIGKLRAKPIRSSLMDKIIEIADVYCPPSGIPAAPGKDDDL